MLETIWKLLIERTFDIFITLLFLCLEYYNYRKSSQYEKKIEAKLKKIQNEIEFTNQLAYDREEEKIQDFGA